MIFWPPDRTVEGLGKSISVLEVPLKAAATVAAGARKAEAENQLLSCSSSHHCSPHHGPQGQAQAGRHPQQPRLQGGRRKGQQGRQGEAQGGGHQAEEGEVERLLNGWIREINMSFPAEQGKAEGGRCQPGRPPRQPPARGRAEEEGEAEAQAAHHHHHQDERGGRRRLAGGGFRAEDGGGQVERLNNIVLKIISAVMWKSFIFLCAVQA